MHTATFPPLMAGLLSAGAAACGLPAAARAQRAPQTEPAVCRPCHQAIVDTYTKTAHYHTPAEPTPAAVLGQFSPGHNVLRTRVPGVYFVIHPRSDGFYETLLYSAHPSLRSALSWVFVGSDLKFHP